MLVLPFQPLVPAARFQTLAVSLQPFLLALPLGHRGFGLNRQKGRALCSLNSRQLETSAQESGPSFSTNHQIS
jgi:hypothetical protein